MCFGRDLLDHPAQLALGLFHARGAAGTHLGAHAAGVIDDEGHPGTRDGQIVVTDGSASGGGT